MTTPVYQLVGVSKSFGEKRIFDGLMLDIRRGETLSVLGGSGSGKSVLLKLLVGLVAPDGGSIRFGGQELTALTEDAWRPVRRRVSMLFQSGALFDSLSVAENIAYPLERAGGYSRTEIADRVADRLELVGLPGIEERRPAELSGGMRKRVALARAIAGDPEVVLYDEPTAGLDPLSTRRIDDLIRSIQERLGVTSVLVTHDLPSAYRISDRIAMLGDQRIIAVLSPADFRSSAKPAIREFVTAMETP